MFGKIFASVLTLMFLASFSLNSQETFTVAVLPFSEKDKSVEGYGSAVADLIFAELAVNPDIFLVERAEIKKITDELELGASGLASPDSAAKIGKIAGAKILITGNVFKVKDQIYIIAKIMSSETSRVIGKKVEGSSVPLLAKELGTNISATIKTDATRIMPDNSEKNILASLKKTVDGNKLPVFVSISERHISAETVDPAAETEFMKLLKELNFELVPQDQAKIVITGEAFSELASRRGNLVCVRSRIEVKAVSASGKIISVARENGVNVGMAEQIAGKAALQEAALKAAASIISDLVKN